MTALHTGLSAVLFDLDGTLIDSTPVVVRSWLRWAEAEAVDPARLQGFHGVPAAQIVAALLPQDRVADACARIHAIELDDVEGVRTLPGAADALAVLAPRAAVVTSCTRALADVRVAAAGLRCPEVVVTADDVTRGKPDPEPYLLGAARLGVDPARCLVVEDAPSGLAAARAAGCVTLAVATTHSRGELEADHVVADLSEVEWRVVDGQVGVSRAVGAPR